MGGLFGNVFFYALIDMDIDDYSLRIRPPTGVTTRAC